MCKHPKDYAADAVADAASAAGRASPPQSPRKPVPARATSTSSDEGGKGARDARAAARAADAAYARQPSAGGSSGSAEVRVDLESAGGGTCRSQTMWPCGRAEDADEWGGFSARHFAVGLLSGLLLNFGSFVLRCTPVGKGPSFHNGNIVGIILNTVILAVLLFAGLIPLPTRHEVEEARRALARG